MSRQNEKNLRLVAFEPEHFTRMKHRPENLEDVAGIALETLLAACQGGHSLLLDDEPLLIYGSERSGITAGLWAYTSTLAGRMPLAVTHVARAYIAQLFAQGVLRVEALCHVNNTRSYKWMTRLLGFKHEGTLRRSGPNRQDRHFLSIIIEDRME